MIYQIGLGAYFPIGDNIDIKFGWIFVYGFEIPITDWLRFPIFVKFDILDDLHAAVTFNSGFTLKF